MGTCQGIRTQDLPAKAVRRCWRVFSWGVRAQLYFGRFPLGVSGEWKAGGGKECHRGTVGPVERQVAVGR